MPLTAGYEIVSRLGSGWEGEVFIIRERKTGIERAAKFFFPHRNLRNKTSTFYARKLHKLRDCPIVISYHSQERIIYRGLAVTFLVSDYVEGEILSSFLSRQPRGCLSPFQGVHLLHALAQGLEKIHDLGEYHGDLHSDNIIVRRHGLGFDLKLLDFFHWGRAKSINIQEDIFDLLKLFFEALGGTRTYHSLPPEIKAIILGRKRSLIKKKFKNAGALRGHLENMRWS